MVWGWDAVKPSPGDIPFRAGLEQGRGSTATTSAPPQCKPGAKLPQHRDTGMCFCLGRQDRPLDPQQVWAGVLGSTSAPVCCQSAGLPSLGWLILLFLTALSFAFSFVFHSPEDDSNPSALLIQNKETYLSFKKGCREDRERACHLFVTL